jgi:hypothetical protein
MRRRCLRAVAIGLALFAAVGVAGCSDSGKSAC